MKTLSIAFFVFAGLFYLPGSFLAHQIIHPPSAKGQTETSASAVCNTKVKLKVRMGSVTKGCPSFALRICEVFIVLTNELQTNPNETLVEVTSTEANRLKLTFNKEEMGPGYAVSYFKEDTFHLEEGIDLGEAVASRLELPEAYLAAGSYPVITYPDRFEILIHRK